MWGPGAIPNGRSPIRTLIEPQENIPETAAPPLIWAAKSRFIKHLPLLDTRLIVGRLSKTRSKGAAAESVACHMD